MIAVDFLTILLLLAVLLRLKFDLMYESLLLYIIHICIILLLLALHVVISCMMSRLKWCKLQECLSLHRLLDTFPNITASRRKLGVGHHGGVRPES